MVCRYAMLVALVLALRGTHVDAAVLVHRPTGGGALEVDRAEDLISLLGRGYEILTPAETAEWQKRRHEQDIIDARITRDAESRSTVMITGILLTVFVLASFVLVYWLRNHKLR